jgi:transposase
MQAVTTIGLDIAKSIFQVHGVDAAGQVLIRRQLKRRAVLAFFQKPRRCQGSSEIGGFSGAETAAAMNDFLKASSKFFSNLDARDAKVVLVHSGDVICRTVPRT